ncbi:Inosine-5'-monophosphate dehydrogenase [uncultured archaeon]|nr:Inosine-5'-monophosphate dehydrogenase [uncultured archaeon]
MAKQIILEPGRTFQEFSLLPGFTKSDCTITNINLEAKLAGLALRIPLFSAAMMSVTGYDMALALGKEGGLGVLPNKLPVDVQAGIVRKIKNYEMAFVEEPIAVRETATIDEACKIVEQQGHSKVPVVDRNNVFLGLFNHNEYLKMQVSRDELVIRAMLKAEQVPYVAKPDLTVDEAKQILVEKKEHYLVVLDGQKRLVKLAFKKDEEKIKVGVAISTHQGWEERVEANLAEGADLIAIDTSDAFNEFAGNVTSRYKELGESVPLCAGNVITYDGAMYLMRAGADIVKVGMSSGSICITQREKAVGRAPMTALMECDRARRDYYRETKRYVPLIADGGVTCPADMIIALTIADAVMMGGYFNRFFEAAGEKIDENGKTTTDEKSMREVATWGEGSLRAKNLDRYGQTMKTFFAEGVEGTVPYRGRLKPTLKLDLMKVRAALSNAGCFNLEQFRRDAVIELNSPTASYIIGNAHDVKTK